MTTDGEGDPATETLSLTQLGAPPTLVVTPDMATDLSMLVAAGGMVSVNIDIGGGAERWVITEWPDFVVDPTMTEGTADADITFTYNPNTTTASRMGDLTVESRGGTGDNVTRTHEFVQLAPTQTLMVTPDMAVDLSALPSTGGTVSVAIDIGGGATGWAVQGTQTFAMPSPTSGNADGTMVITYGENTGNASRMDEVTIVTTGEGDAITFVIALTQLAPVPTLALTTDPMDLTMLPAAASTVSLTITPGGSATAWSITDRPDFVAEPMMTTGTGMMTVILNVTENAAAMRSGDLVVVTTNGEGAPATRTLSLTQVGAAPTLALTTDPMDLTMLPAAASTVSLTITPGGSATAWSITETPDFVAEPMMATGTGTMTVTLNVTENMAAMRSGNLTVVTTDGMGDPATRTLSLTQLGVPPTLMLSTMPMELSMLPAAASMVELTITPGGSATGWSITTRPDFVAAPAMMTGTGPATITLNVTENSMDETRTGNLAVSTTGGGGDPATETLVFTQLATVAEAQTIMLDPTSLADVPAAGGMRTVGLTFGGGATGFTVPTTGEGARRLGWWCQRW